MHRTLYMVGSAVTLPVRMRSHTARMDWPTGLSRPADDLVRVQRAVQVRADISFSSPVLRKDVFLIPLKCAAEATDTAPSL